MASAPTLEPLGVVLEDQPFEQHAGDGAVFFGKFADCLEVVLQMVRDGELLQVAHLPAEALAGAQAGRGAASPYRGPCRPAKAPDERLATDLCRVWGGRDGWLTLALVMDRHTRQVLGWQLSRSGKATMVAAALEQALITRYGTLGRVPEPFLLRSDNGLVFTSRHYTRLVHSYGLKQEFITPHCPQQNGMVERLIRTVKEQCVHRHRFENQRHAMRVLGDWIQFYNNRRPHQALGMKIPAEA